MFWIEVVGYIGTALVVTSLSMKSIVRLRILNASGGLLFVIYAAIINSVPVMALNLTTATLNIFHLISMRRKKDRFEILEAKSIDDPLMQRFINYYRDDILTYFGVPDFSRQKDYLVCYILRNMVPAGIFIGEKQPDDNKGVNVRILIDYVTPEYRDMKNSKFLFFGNRNWLQKHRISKFYMQTENATHQKYLKKIGFTPTGTAGAFELTVPQSEI